LYFLPQEILDTIKKCTFGERFFMDSIINIYQIFTRLFANSNENNQEFGTIEENGCSKFDDITNVALDELRKMGITHVWYTGVIRHASCTNYTKYGLSADNPQVVKGRAGSPYAIKDYYDVDPDLATNVRTRMQEFENLVQRTHDANLKCIIDFVPNHVSREYNSDNLPDGGTSLGSYDDTSVSFAPNNNFYYIPNEELHLPNDITFPYNENAEKYEENPAKVTGNDVFSAYPNKNDWYETIKLNYGVDFQDCWKNHFEQIPDTWIRMYEILSFWAKKDIDGFRCDMAEMVPVEFWGWAIPQIKEIKPDIIFIAEIYNPDAYSTYLDKGHFDYLYDKVGLYDTMRLIVEGNGSARYISDYWRRTEAYTGKMLRFLENHDEQRIASCFFAHNGDKAIAAMILLATLNKGPLMIYFGQEIGEQGMNKEGFSGIDGRTSIFDYWGMTEFNKWVNGGKFDGAGLSESQKDLRQSYCNLLSIRLESKTIQEGDFYDLMWVNQNNLNADKIFAFLRYTNDEKLLIIVNFDYNETQTFRLNIGEHALKTMDCPLEGELTIKSIFEETFTDAFPMEEIMDEGMPISILPNSALIFKLEWK